MPSGRRSLAISRAPRPRGGKAARDIAVVESAIGRAGRILGPVRRPEPLHPAALLIDQHQRVAADRLAAFAGEPRDLLRVS